MLSQVQLKKADLADYPRLPQPRTVRIKFRKIGNLQYISHLDLQRTVSRVLVRAGIPMWYTQGFNPHAKIVYGLPLSVGAQSLCEYMDLRIDRDMPCDQIKSRLNAALTDELCVLEAYVPTGETAFGDIVWASYDIRVRTAGLTAAFADEMRAYLTTSPLMMDKKSKSGIRQVDITTLIRSLDVTLNKAAAPDGEDELRIQAVLCVSGSDYLNPEYLITALRTHFGILPEGDVQSEYSILRTNVWLADGKTEFR